MSKPPKLSNVQNQRMGGLISVLCGREPYPWLAQKLLDGQFIFEMSGVAGDNSQGFALTINGYKELERLMTLCGLAMFYRNGVPEIHATKAQRSPDKTGDTR